MVRRSQTIMFFNVPVPSDNIFYVRHLSDVPQYLFKNEFINAHDVLFVPLASKDQYALLVLITIRLVGSSWCRRWHVCDGVDWNCLTAAVTFDHYCFVLDTYYLLRPLLRAWSLLYIVLAMAFAEASGTVRSFVLSTKTCDPGVTEGISRMFPSYSSLFVNWDLRIQAFTLACKGVICFCRSFCIDCIKFQSAALGVLSIVALSSNGFGSCRDSASQYGEMLFMRCICVLLVQVRSCKNKS